LLLVAYNPLLGLWLSVGLAFRFTALLASDESPTASIGNIKDQTNPTASLPYGSALSTSESKPLVVRALMSYRASGAVLNLGQSVVDLIHHFFPLPTASAPWTERGAYSGPLPCLLPFEEPASLFTLLPPDSSPRRGFVRFYYSLLVLAN